MIIIISTLTSYLQCKQNDLFRVASSMEDVRKEDEKMRRDVSLIAMFEAFGRNWISSKTDKHHISWQSNCVRRSECLMRDFLMSAL